MIEPYNKFNFVISARDDYVREEGDEDLLLFNPKWKVQPSIAFIEGKGPCVLSCRDHDFGNKFFMIHPCRQPKHILPAETSDQLCHAVIKSRTIKPVKASAFSNAFQMHTQTGTFNGLDTCSCTTFHKFDKCSKLSSEIVSRSITNRPDINAHVNTLVSENVLSNFAANGMREEALRISQSIDYEPYMYGSTFVPLEVAMTLQREVMDEDCEALNDERGENLPDIRKYFKKSWPSCIFPCQILNDYGARFPSIPAFNSNVHHTELLWTLSALLTRSETLWQLTVHLELRTSRWHGWLLIYLTKQCFPNIARRQDTKDPFKSNQVRTIPRIMEKVHNGLQEDGNFGDLFLDYAKVLYIDIAAEESDEIVIATQNHVNNIHQVLIVNSFCQTINGAIQLSLDLNGAIFQLRILLRTWNNGDKWDGEVYSRHDDMSWWYQRRNDKLARHSFLPDSLVENNMYYLVYVRVQETDIASLGSEFLKYLGGQKHVRCAEHRLPLITSTERTGKCNCNRKETYCCSQLGCKVCICQSCIVTHDENNVTYIEVIIADDDNDNSLEEPRREDNSDDDGLEEPRHDDDDDNFDGDPFFNGEGNDQNGYGGEENDILQKDDFDDFLTSTYDPDIPNTELNDNDEDAFNFDPIPTTNAGEFAYEVSDEMIKSGTFGDMVISGHVLLNQCGTLLTRKKYQIKGSSRHKFFLQRICATTIGSSIPLLYPEAMIFPSIHWKMADTSGSIAGAIPAPLLTESIKRYGFQSIQQHVRSRLTSSSCATSTDSRYIAFYYDKLTNLSINHQDTRIVLNRGLTAAGDESGGLGLRGKGDSALLESIDSKQMVKNLCSSQKYHKMDFFLTFTCNQKKHFGMSPLKEWVDSKEWIKHYPDYHDLNVFEREEIEKAVLQASGGLLLRNWQEVCKLFLDYLRKSPSSPYRKVLSIFARNEYQKEVGNLSHIHLMLQIYWKLLNESQTAFVMDLIRASILDIVRSDEIESLINDGIFRCVEDHKAMVRDAESFLPHRCNSRCQAAVSPGVFRCRKLNNLKVTTDNTKHVFKPLPNDYSAACIDRLIQIGLVEPLSINEEGYQRPFKSSIPFFHPARHIPPTNPTNDMNISPVEGYTFSACRSMQNAQMLTACGGVKKYVCKYIGKIDEQNYIVVSVDGSKSGSLVTKSSFLHNTKVTSTKINEDKERETKRENKRVQGRAISQMEMLHMMLKYPEVFTDLNFVAIPTMPLELRAGIDIDTKNDNIEDGAQVGIVSNEIRRGLDLPEWRQHSDSEMLTLEDLKMSKVSIDKISEFSVRPPEFRSIFDYIGQYYRWFSIVRKKLNGEKMNEKLSATLEESYWIDGLQRQVRVRRKALPEILQFFDDKLEVDVEADDNPTTIMSSLFRRIIRVLRSESNNEEINDSDSIFLYHAKSNLIDEDEDQDHLPVPVYSYIKPTMGVQFLLHVMLSMGRLSSEIDLMMHRTIQECFRFAKLIGPSDEPDDLQHYSNLLLLKFIVEQMIYFPNSKRIIDSWIVTAGDLFDSVIVHDKIPIADMPPVQQTTLFASIEANIIEYKRETRSKLIDAALKELANAVNDCNIPVKEDLELCTKEAPFDWDAVQSYSRNQSQSIDSFNEQKLAIQICVDAIDSYCNILTQDVYTKNVGIRGFPGSGKTWIMLYVAMYCVSRGLAVTTTAMMSKRSIHLGGKHWHYIFCLPIEKNLTPHRMAELAICKILSDPKKLNALLTLDILLCDEMGQVPAELLSVIDIILRRIRSNNIFLGGLLIICTLDHTQIQPVQGRPFLTSTHIIPCFKMVSFENSIRASGDANFQRIHKIAKFNYMRYEQEPELIDEFVRLASEHLTFVDNWNDEIITPSTYRLYGRRVPAKEAARQFIERVRRSFEPNQLREKKAEDVQKHRRIRLEWMPASETTSSTLEQILKEPEVLLFFRGAVFECTYNVEGKFSQSQMALLFDLPSQEDLNTWRPIKILVAPPGMTDVEFDNAATKASYIALGFIEVKIGVAPERTQSIKGNIQAQRKQYGLKHRVTGTIHAAMGDTLLSMATEISKNDANYRLWDKGQLVVILSRTKLAKNTIFVGDKDDTIAALKDLLTRKTQWTDYMEQVLDLISVNSQSEAHRLRTMTQAAFPFRMCDVTLPQCRTGFVYMLMSIKRQNYTYIGQTICIRTRIQQHNSGYGSTSTQPAYLRPFALLAYICGFGNRRILREHVEYQWKLKRDHMIRNGINDAKRWAQCGQDVINEITLQDYTIAPSDLTLVLLYQHDDE